MGIYDRDYYREEGGGFWGSVTGHKAVWTIIGVTVVLWLAAIVTSYKPDSQAPSPWSGPISEWFAFHLESVLDGQVWRLLTCHFVHHPADLFGVLLGMLALWWFGTSLEEIYGPREFAAFYLGTALIAGLAELLAGLIVRSPDHRAEGAGDVLTAVLALYACHFPYARIYVMFILPVPAWLLVTVIVGLSLLSSLNNPAGPVPTLAAVGFAVLYYRTQVRLSPPVVAVWDRVAGLFAGRAARRRPALRVAPDPDDDSATVAATAPTPPKASAKPARSVDEQLEAKLDHVLEKVSRYGRDSLTAEEQEILLKASEIYKRRRGK